MIERKDFYNVDYRGCTYIFQVLFKARKKKGCYLCQVPFSFVEHYPKILVKTNKTRIYKHKDKYFVRVHINYLQQRVPKLKATLLKEF